MSKTIYLAGKVSGLDMVEATQKFGLKEVELRRNGHTVINPLNIVDKNDTWPAAMKKCIPALMQCDELHLLPCWKDSPGATLERDIAQRVGITIIYY